MGDAPLGSLTAVRRDGVVALVVEGEFDVNLSSPLAESVGDGSVDVEIDLSGVTFMDSTGIRLLLLTRSEVHGAGRSWCITAASPVAYDLLSVAGLVQRLGVPTPAGADSSLL